MRVRNGVVFTSTICHVRTHCQRLLPGVSPSIKLITLSLLYGLFAGYAFPLGFTIAQYTPTLIKFMFLCIIMESERGWECSLNFWKRQGGWREIYYISIYFWYTYNKILIQFCMIPPSTIYYEGPGLQFETLRFLYSCDVRNNLWCTMTRFIPHT